MKSITITVVVAPDGEIGAACETHLEGVQPELAGEAYGAAICAASSQALQCSAALHDLDQADGAAFSEGLKRSIEQRRNQLPNGFVRVQSGASPRGGGQ